MQPFTPEASPLRLQAKARRIPNWTLDANGLLRTLHGLALSDPTSRRDNHADSDGRRSAADHGLPDDRRRPGRA